MEASLANLNITPIEKKHEKTMETITL